MNACTIQSNTTYKSYLPLHLHIIGDAHCTGFKVVPLCICKPLTVDQGKFEFKPDRPLVPAKYRPDSILCQLGFNFDGAARLFTVPGLSQACLTYPSSLVQCALFYMVEHTAEVPLCILKH